MRIKLSKKILVFGTALMLSAYCQAADYCAMISETVTFYFGVETEIPDPYHPITVDTYHTDLEVSFIPSGWDLIISHDSPGSPIGGVAIDPAEGLLYANANARITLASIPAAFGFIGAQPNKPFWVMPQTPGNGALALGFAVELSASSALCNWDPNASAVGADVPAPWYRVQLLDVRGPDDAHFSLWQADGIHPPVVFMSTAQGGITEEDAFYLSDGSHAHLNWGFTEMGLYEIDFEISTVYMCDGLLVADLWPLGNDDYVGDCIVDLRDFTVLATNWLRMNCSSQSDYCQRADFALPLDDQVGFEDLLVLIDQWLACGYPGCDL